MLYDKEKYIIAQLNGQHSPLIKITWQRHKVNGLLYNQTKESEAMFLVS